MAVGRFRLQCLSVVWTVAAAVAQAQNASVPLASALVGEVTFSKGVGFAQTPGQTPRTLGVGLPLREGDRLTTAVGGSAIIRLTDGTRMTLRPQTDLVLAQYQYQQDTPGGNMVLDLLQGGFRAITGLISKGSAKAAQVRTPTATIGIRGTDFDARVCGADCAADVRQSSEATRPTNMRASAKAVGVQGQVSVQAHNGDRRQVVDGGSVYPGDLVETGSNAGLVLAFRDESRVTLGGGTRFRVDDFVYDHAQPAEGRFLVSLLKGTVRALTGLIGKARTQNVSFKTPTATLGIRGTGLDLSCADDGCSFFNWLGSITVTPEGHSALQVLEAGQGLFVSPTGMRPIEQLPLPHIPRPDGVPVDVGPLFAAAAVGEGQQGLYVFVRDGHIELATPSGVLHLGRGEVGLADAGGRLLRPVLMPRFIEFDPTPKPDHPNPLLASILGESGIRASNQCR